MKKIILLSSITATMLLATNGDIMLGDGAKASGMGGVGIAVSHGSESLYANPAMIKDIKKSEFSAYMTYFSPNVNFASDAGSDTGGGVSTPSSTPIPNYASSDVDKSFIPGFAYVHRNNDHIVWGVSLAGTAGMGTDYKNGSPSSGVFGMKTDIAIAKLSIPVAYTTNNLTVALSPVLQYSTLEINSQYMDSTGAFKYSNNKKDSSIGLGYTAGLAYEIGSITLGAVYKSKIEAEYKDNIKKQTQKFGFNNGAGVASGDKLDQPSEMGVGVAYIMGKNTFSIDGKRVEWAKASGYKDFGWENQNIISLGYQYRTPVWAIRAGYNYGKSPIVELDGSATYNGTNYQNAATNYFNLSGFPAIVEEHFTLGGDYKIDKNFELSLAFVYSPEVTESFDTTAMSAGLAFNGARANGATVQQAGATAQAASTGSTANVKHSQKALTIGVNYSF